MRIKKYILEQKSSLNENKRLHVTIPFQELRESKEFSIKQEKQSLLNIALVLDNYQPEVDFIFSLQEVEKWAEEYDLFTLLDHLNQTVHFFSKHPLNSKESIGKGNC